MTSGRQFGPEIFRHFFLADITHTFNYPNKDCGTSVLTRLKASCASILVGIETGGQIVKCLID